MYRESGKPTAEDNDWRQFRPRTDETGRVLGLESRDGVFYPFQRGETIFFPARNDADNERTALVRIPGGDELSFAEWIGRQAA